MVETNNKSKLLESYQQCANALQEGINQNERQLKSIQQEKQDIQVKVDQAYQQAAIRVIEGTSLPVLKEEANPGVDTDEEKAQPNIIL